MPQDEYFHSDPNLYYTETNVPENEDEIESLTQGCECQDGSCNDSTKCQCLKWSSGQNYDSNSKLLGPKRGPIFECSSSCLCTKEKCGNRVVQKGPILGNLSYLEKSK